ncbi:MAG TPA: DUF5606 domain-containing protein [Bacteroidales bacterium]|nr:DUF5606 domain-containing protein [Bacteroidales bacterium]
MLKDILSISGHGGLFKFISQGRHGIIVESLETKKRMNASATARISALEDITIFTDTEDIALKDIFKAIYKKENEGEAIPHKSSADELKNYFAEILPDYDRDRVYVSDIKKVVQWYNQLHKLKMLNFEEEEEKTDDEKEQTADKDKTESKEEMKKVEEKKDEPKAEKKTKKDDKGRK